MSTAIAGLNAENVGRVLKEERHNMGLDLRGFGGQIDISAQTLSRIENGTANLKLAQKKKIADYFKCSVTDIWPVASEEDAE